MEDTAEVVGAKAGGEKFKEQTQTRVCVRARVYILYPWENETVLFLKNLESFSDIIVISF